jgi:hypothetical protein
MTSGFNVIITATSTTTSFARWKFAAVGDIECTHAKKIAHTIEKYFQPVVVLLLGDLGYGQSAKCSKDAFPNGLPTIGNHDYKTDILKVFKLKNPVYSHAVNEITFLSYTRFSKFCRQTSWFGKEPNCTSQNTFPSAVLTLPLCN